MKILEMVQKLGYYQTCSGDVIGYKKSIVNGKQFPYIALVLDLKAQVITKHLRIDLNSEAIPLSIEREEAVLAVCIFEENEEV